MGMCRFLLGLFVIVDRLPITAGCVTAGDLQIMSISQMSNRWGCSGLTTNFYLFNEFL